MGLGEDDELGHVRDTDDFPIHLSGEVDRFLDLPTVYEPEPRNQKRVRSELVSVADIWFSWFTWQTRWW